MSKIAVEQNEEGWRRKMVGETRFTSSYSLKGQVDASFALVPQMLGTYYLFPLLITFFISPVISLKSVVFR